MSAYCGYCLAKEGAYCSGCGHCAQCCKCDPPETKNQNKEVDPRDQEAMGDDCC